MATWKKRAPGETPGAKYGCVPLSKSLPTLVLRFLLCETGYSSPPGWPMAAGLRFKRPRAGPHPATPCGSRRGLRPPRPSPLARGTLGPGGRRQPPGGEPRGLLGPRGASAVQRVTSAAFPGQRAPPSAGVAARARSQQVPRPGLARTRGVRGREGVKAAGLGAGPGLRERRCPAAG